MAVRAAVAVAVAPAPGNHSGWKSDPGAVINRSCRTEHGIWGFSAT